MATLISHKWLFKNRLDLDFNMILNDIYCTLEEQNVYVMQAYCAKVSAFFILLHFNVGCSFTFYVRLIFIYQHWQKISNIGIVPILAHPQC